MAIRKLSPLPLLDIQSTAFAEQYELGAWWGMSGEREGKGPLPASYLVNNLTASAQHGSFPYSDPSYQHHLGFYIGMYHGGVLDQTTGACLAGVSTLARLDHPDAQQGYRAGREYFFVEADPPGQRLSERYLIERIQQDVVEMVHWRDTDATWFYAVGCLLGELSGSLFPQTPEEAHAWREVSCTGEDEQKQDAALFQEAESKV